MIFEYVESEAKENVLQNIIELLMDDSDIEYIDVTVNRWNGGHTKRYTIQALRNAFNQLKTECTYVKYEDDKLTFVLPHHDATNYIELHDIKNKFKKIERFL